MSKNKNRFFNVSVTNGTLSIDMYDYIGDMGYGEGITETMVTNALKGSDSKSVTLNINSPGGDAFAGVAIRNVLVQSSKKVIVNVVGLAASAASIVAMAGDSITMCGGSVMMIHPAQACNMGSAADFRKMADTLDTVTGSIADVYAAKTGLPKDKVLDMMNAETWMDSDEAVKLGFATAVSKDKAAVRNSFDLSTFRNVPVSLKAEAEATEEDNPDTDNPECECTCPGCKAGNCDSCDNADCDAEGCSCPQDATVEPNEPVGAPVPEAASNMALLHKQLEINRRK